MILSHSKSRFSQAIFDLGIQAALQEHIDHGCEILRCGQMQKGASDGEEGELEVAVVRPQGFHHSFSGDNFVELDSVFKDSVKVAFGNGAHGGECLDERVCKDIFVR